jgi:hypothetical protein
MAGQNCRKSTQDTREAITAAEETAGRDAEGATETVERSVNMIKRASEAVTNGYDKLPIRS